MSAQTPLTATTADPPAADPSAADPVSRRAAIVTGGSRGIGRQVVTRLAEAGFAVVVGYAGNRSAAEQAATAVTSAGGRAIAVAADVADEDAVERLFDAAHEAFGGVDVVVHAAGRMELATVAELDLAVLDRLLRTNVRGTFVVAQQAARRLRSGGSLIMFSSSVVATRFETYGAYAATKAAVEPLSLILARELRGRNITVNTVAPGPTATELFLDGKDEAAVERLARIAPLERLGEPADIAELVAFLASPAGHWVNGQTVRANGGMV